jgi:excisionase family DNA binding protein
MVATLFWATDPYVVVTASGPARPRPRPRAGVDDDSLMTIGDVAELLRLTPKGVYAMVAARRIPFVRVSNRLRFRLRDVEAWLDGNRVDTIRR